ncbi:MAG: 16S rRNA (adenine(1518)-N(6)/adenine(1519)-N(6))-dimethyltransferase RsmA [Candidatus Dojkabacteria bacterium]
MRPKKSLGQNFFTNQNLAKSIIKIVLEKKPEVTVEIGPGRGYFTQIINETPPEHLILIEKDLELSTDLNIFIPNAVVKNTDFLEWQFDELKPLKDKNIIFFGSLPYNVSKPIIRKIIESEYFNENCFFIIQKEVAEKYVVKALETNLLSVETEIYAKVEKVFDISPASFSPRPKVDSSFVKLSPKKKEYEIDLIPFKSFLRSAFRQPRKTLKNNLRDMVFKNEDTVNTLLAKRAQHLSLDEYIFLFSKRDTILV